MLKFLILLSISIVSSIASQGPADYNTDGHMHSYSIGVEIGEMDSEPGALPLIITLLKEVRNNEWVGDESQVSESIIIKSNSHYNFTITTDMPFDQIDTVSFTWQDMNEFYGYVDDIYFETAYLTETTESCSNTCITKKYCATDPYPRNLAGSIGGRNLDLC